MSTPPERINYTDCATIVWRWVRNGLVRPFSKEEYSPIEWNTFDEHLFAIFGMPLEGINEHGFTPACVLASEKFRGEELKWLWGPHALTLFKMRLVQHGYGNNSK